MIEFKEIKSEVFKAKPTCSQILYLFTDALAFVDRYVEHEQDLYRTVCDVYKDSFTIRLRVLKLDVLTFPVLWFESQSYTFSQVRPDAVSSITIKPYINDSSIIDLEYKLYFDLPF